MLTEKDILYEDNHFIAINKEAGQLVQGDKTGDPSLSDLLAEFLKKKYNKPGNVFTGVIHRIDRPVSGLVLMAKTSKGLARMNELFKGRDIEKSYICIVEGKMNEKNGKLVSFLKKDQAKNKSFSSTKEKEGFKKAELNFSLLAHLDNYSVLEVHPKTGRHHQIRVQLATAGFPIKGDLKYGAKRSNKDASISLHSRSLSFIHPIKKEKLKILAHLPETDIWPHVSID